MRIVFHILFIVYTPLMKRSSEDSLEHIDIRNMAVAMSEEPRTFARTYGADEITDIHGSLLHPDMRRGRVSKYQIDTAVVDTIMYSIMDSNQDDCWEGALQIFEARGYQAPETTLGLDFVGIVLHKSRELHIDPMSEKIVCLAYSMFEYVCYKMNPMFVILYKALRTFMVIATELSDNENLRAYITLTMNVPIGVGINFVLLCASATLMPMGTISTSWIPSSIGDPFLVFLCRKYAILFPHEESFLRDAFLVNHDGSLIYPEPDIYADDLDPDTSSMLYITLMKHMKRLIDAKVFDLFAYVNTAFFNPATLKHLIRTNVIDATVALKLRFNRCPYEKELDKYISEKYKIVMIDDSMENEEKEEKEEKDETEERIFNIGPPLLVTDYISPWVDGWRKYVTIPCPIRKLDYSELQILLEKKKYFGWLESRLMEVLSKRIDTDNNNSDSDILLLTTYRIMHYDTLENDITDFYFESTLAEPDINIMVEFLPVGIRTILHTRLEYVVPIANRNPCILQPSAMEEGMASKLGSILDNIVMQSPSVQLAFWNRLSGEEYCRMYEDSWKSHHGKKIAKRCAELWMEADIVHDPSVVERINVLAAKKRGDHGGTGPRQPIDTFDPTECSVCMDRKIDTVIYPCNHEICCWECMLRITDDKYALCPICRCRIKGIQKVVL